MAWPDNYSKDVSESNTRDVTFGTSRYSSDACFGTALRMVAENRYGSRTVYPRLRVLSTNSKLASGSSVVLLEHSGRTLGKTTSRFCGSTSRSHVVYFN